LGELIGGVGGEGEEGRKCLDVDEKKSRDEGRARGRRAMIEARLRGIRLARGTRRRGEMSDIFRDLKVE